MSAGKHPIEVGTITWHPDPPILLTKREYFVAMAMQGLLANPNQQHGNGLLEDAFFYADRALDWLAKAEGK